MGLRSDTEVLVVGAGPVGMVAAAYLGSRGVRVQVVEKGYRPAARSYALALHPASLALLDELGVAREVVERGKIVDTIAFYEGGERRAEVSVAALETAFPFVLVLAQSALEEVLARHLKASRVDLLWNCRGACVRPGEDRVEAVVEKMVEEAPGYVVKRRGAVKGAVRTHASFVIGADGYASMVRRALGLDYQDLGGAQTFGVFELEAAWNPQQETRVVLEPGSTSVLWPLGGRRLRWSFELTAEERASPRLKRRLLMQMGEEAFPYIAQELLEDLIEARAPWFSAPIQNVTWSVGVRFERRLVPRFGHDGVWLAGDAAHLAGPVGVHSMNVGLREARDLAQGVGDVLRDGAPRDVLERYNGERMAEWRTLFGLDGQTVVDPSAAPWVEANAARIVAALPASGEDLRLLAAQIGIGF